MKAHTTMKLQGKSESLWNTPMEGTYKYFLYDLAKNQRSNRSKTQKRLRIIIYLEGSIRCSQRSKETALT